ncbi:hypothetical protein FKM82_011936 [Ascaphus truei]
MTAQMSQILMRGAQKTTTTGLKLLMNFTMVTMTTTRKAMLKFEWRHHFDFKQLYSLQSLSRCFAILWLMFTEIPVMFFFGPVQFVSWIQRAFLLPDEALLKTPAYTWTPLS